MLPRRRSAIITSLRDGTIVALPRRDDPPFDKIKAALQGFVARWQSAPPREADRPLRQVDATITLGCIGVILVVALYVDEPVAHWAQHLPAEVVSLARVITQFGVSTYIFVIAAVVALFAVLSRRGQSPRIDAGLLLLADRASFIIILNAVAGIAAQIVKFIFGRTRPMEMDIVGPFDFNVFSFHAHNASFPSGHAVTVFSTALALSWMEPRLRLPLFILAILVGLSRIALADHYASDVLAGALIGLGTAILLRRAFARRGIAFDDCDAGIRLRGRGILAAAFTASVPGAARTSTAP